MCFHTIAVDDKYIFTSNIPSAYQLVDNLIFSSALCALRTRENYETIWHARKDILADYFLRKIYK
jgi:hypothetical protein